VGEGAGENQVGLVRERFFTPRLRFRNSGGSTTWSISSIGSRPKLRNARQGRLAEHLTDFVILDELGYLPFAQSGGQLLFHLISRLYERTSIYVTMPFCGARPNDRVSWPGDEA
jgi:hypothetical protein